MFCFTVQLTDVSNEVARVVRSDTPKTIKLQGIEQGIEHQNLVKKSSTSKPSSTFNKRSSKYKRANAAHAKHTQSRSQASAEVRHQENYDDDHSLEKDGSPSRHKIVPSRESNLDQTKKSFPLLKTSDVKSGKFMLLVKRLA